MSNELTIKQLVELSHAYSVKNGFYDSDDCNVPEKLALVHSEISEALEEYRNCHMDRWMNGAKPEGFGIELADAVIRIADLCGYLGIDLESEIREKMAYNETRPYRHGGKAA